MLKGRLQLFVDFNCTQDISKVKTKQIRLPDLTIFYILYNYQQKFHHNLINFQSGDTLVLK